MNDESPKTKDRSPNFPFIPLEAALVRAQQFYAKEKRGAAPYKAAAEHWKYSASSSGGMQTVAALKSYGLIADEGSGPQRTVRLTDLALRILLDQRPDSQERNRYIAEAAMSPAVAREVYTKWEGDLPSEATLRHYLVLDRAFNDANAHKVVKILYLNHIFAEIDSSGRSLSPTELEEDMIVEQPTNTHARADSSSGHRMPLAAVMPAVALPRLIDSERVMAPDAAVLMEFSATPTWETYDFLESYMKLRKSVLKQKGKAEISPSDE